MKIEKFGTDAKGNRCPEGYYAMAPGGLVLMPPGTEMAKGLRLATQEEVDAAVIVHPAAVEHLAGGTVDHEPKSE